MSVPNLPDIDINREYSVKVVIASVGMQELGLAHILNAEGEKMQSFLGTLDGQTVKSHITVDELVELDNAVIDALDAVTSNELLLMAKLSKAKKLCHMEERKRIAYPVQIVWVDDDNEWNTRPQQIILNLQQNGTPYAQGRVSGSLTDYTFRNLPEFDAAGQPYVYTVTQESVTGYETSVTGNIVTNTILSIDITIINYDIAAEYELSRRTIPVPFGSNYTVTAIIMAGWNRVPPITHEFINVREPVSHTFYYYYATP